MFPDEGRRFLTCGEHRDFGPGSMTVVVTHKNGETETFRNILVPTKGEALTFEDGRVKFESDDIRDPILYTVLDVHSIATFAGE